MFSVSVKFLEVRIWLNKPLQGKRDKKIPYSWFLRQNTEVLDVIFRQKVLHWQFLLFLMENLHEFRNDIFGNV